MTNTNDASINLDRNPKTYAPKICQYSRRRGSPRGCEQVYMFVDNVSKGNIAVNFFQLNSAKKRIWMTRIPIDNRDMHHQYGICFYTPAYKEIDIEEDVNVFMELERLSDGRRSTPRVFTYEAEEFYKKRKKRNIFLEKMRPKVENDVAMTPVSQNGAEIQDTSTENIEAAADGHDFIFPFSAVEAYEPAKDPKGVTTKEVDYIIDNTNQLPYNFEDFCHNLDSLAYMGPHADDVECPSALIKAIFNLMKQSVHRWYEDARQNLEKLFEMRSPGSDTFLHLLLVSHLPSFKLMVDMMLSLGLYNLLNEANDLGQTVLHLAVMREMLDVIPYLIEKGCNPACKDKRHNNALHLAITHPASLAPLLKSLKEKEYKVINLAMEPNENRDTALVAAVKLGHLPSVQQLLAANLVTFDDLKSLHFAVANDRLDIVQALIEQLRPDYEFAYWSPDLGHVSPLQLACAGEVRQNTLAFIKLLLDKKASMYLTCNYSSPAWQLAKRTPAIWEVVKPYLDEELLSEHENTSHSTADDERLSTDDGVYYKNENKLIYEKGSQAVENNILVDI